MDSDNDGVGDNSDYYPKDPHKSEFSSTNKTTSKDDERNTNKKTEPAETQFVDTDGDLLSNDFELQIGTDPYKFSTDGDRYSDKLEYEQEVPSYVTERARDPLYPAYPDLSISISDNFYIYLAQTISTTTGFIEMENHIYNIESTSTKTTGWTVTTGFEAGLISAVPYGCVYGEITYYESTTHTIQTKEMHQYASSYEWRQTIYTDLPNSHLKTFLYLENIGTDIFDSEIDSLWLNLYIGEDENPSKIWNFDHDVYGGKIGSLEPGQMRTVEVVFDNWLDSIILSRIDSGEPLRIEIQTYHLGENHQYLQNVKDNLIRIDIDTGDGLIINYQKEEDISLTDFIEKYADADFDSSGNIISIYGIEINEKNQWDIIFPGKTDFNEDIFSIKLDKGDHIVLLYHHDNDNDGLDNRIEQLNGLDPYNPDTDKDGINDYYELHGDTDPLMSD